MLQYAVKLANGKYMKYDQVDSYELLVEDTTSLQYAETFNTSEEAIHFANCINDRKDGEYRILSYENAISIIEINADGEWLSEIDLNPPKQNTQEYIVNVSKDCYAGNVGWVEDIYLDSEDGKNYDEIFEPYVGKKVKLTIEVIE